MKDPAVKPTKKKQQFSEEPVNLSQEAMDLIDSSISDQLKEILTMDRLKGQQLSKHMSQVENKP